MKRKIDITSALRVGLVVTLCLLTSPIQAMAGSSFSGQKKESKSARTGDSQPVVKGFEDRVKEYVKLRERLEEKMPRLSEEARPEEIEAHKKAFQERVRAARAYAKPGDIFTPDIVNYIRATIKREFKGKDLRGLRETVLEAETKGVPVRVNYPYPENKELVEMPPTLLMILPQLPKQVRYRYVGRNMLLVDRENGLIIDYMLDALP